MVDYTKLKEKLNRMPDQRAQSQAQAKDFKEKEPEVERKLKNIDEIMGLSTGIYQRPKAGFNGEDAKTKPIESPLHSKEETAKEEVTAPQPQSMVGVSEQTQKGHEAQPAEPSGETREMKSLSREGLKELPSGEVGQEVQAALDAQAAEIKSEKSEKTCVAGSDSTPTGIFHSVKKKLGLDENASVEETIKATQKEYDLLIDEVDELLDKLRKIHGDNSEAIEKEVEPLLRSVVDGDETEVKKTFTTTMTTIRMKYPSTAKSEEEKSDEEPVPPEDEEERKPTTPMEAPRQKEKLNAEEIKDRLIRGANYNELKDEPNLGNGIRSYITTLTTAGSGIDDIKNDLLKRGFPPEVVTPRTSYPPQPVTPSMIISNESISGKSPQPPPLPKDAKSTDGKKATVGQPIEINMDSGKQAGQTSPIPLAKQVQGTRAAAAGPVGVPEGMTTQEIERASIAPTEMAIPASETGQQLTTGLFSKAAVNKAVELLREFYDKAEDPKVAVKEVKKRLDGLYGKEDIKKAMKSTEFKNLLSIMQNEWPTMKKAIEFAISLANKGKNKAGIEEDLKKAYQPQIIERILKNKKVWDARVNWTAKEMLKLAKEGRVQEEAVIALGGTGSYNIDGNVLAKAVERKDVKKAFAKNAKRTPQLRVAAGSISPQSQGVQPIPGALDGRRSLSNITTELQTLSGYNGRIAYWLQNGCTKNSIVETLKKDPQLTDRDGILDNGVKYFIATSLLVPQTPKQLREKLRQVKQILMNAGFEENKIEGHIEALKYAIEGREKELAKAYRPTLRKKILKWAAIGATIAAIGASGVYLATHHPKQVSGWFKGLKPATKQLSVGKSKQPVKGTKKTIPKGKKKPYEKYLQKLDKKLKSISH
ncbi:MAG: hypothetical protein QXT45_03595 [Candidatus Bilamarchaeaceae archaeon]